jgi:hypothetical protein
MLAAVMALKAYSACKDIISFFSLKSRTTLSHLQHQIGPRTNLIQAPLVGEDGDVSIESRTSYPSNRLAESSYCCDVQEAIVPDMTAAVWRRDQVAKCRNMQDDLNMDSFIRSWRAG